MPVFKMILIIVPVYIFFYIIGTHGRPGFMPFEILLAIVVVGCVAGYLEILKYELIEGLKRPNKENRADRSVEQERR